MLRKIIQIDAERCNGCGACAKACHEGAIAMVDGKAVLQRADYCDGLGDCLPVCPTDAITFVEREVDVQETLPCGCPGSQSKMISRSEPEVKAKTAAQSCLSQWPVQIQLVPVRAPYFEGANLLIAADCTAYAYGDFHSQFIRNRVTLVGCAKLDPVDYTEKLTEIIRNNAIKSVTIVRMEVPCCGGLERAAVTALKNSGKFLPWQVVTITTDGRIKED